MNKVYVLLGGNIGNVAQTFEKARNFINGVAGHITAASSIYRSEPWGFKSNDSFLNQALEVSTILQPLDFLDTLLDIENVLGRKRTKSGYQSRLIDLDILFFNDLIFDQCNLTVPHPRLHERRFTLMPLAEIAPSHFHPVLKFTVQELLENCPDHSLVERASEMKS